MDELAAMIHAVPALDLAGLAPQHRQCIQADPFHDNTIDAQI